MPRACSIPVFAQGIHLKWRGEQETSNHAKAQAFRVDELLVEDLFHLVERPLPQVGDLIHRANPLCLSEIGWNAPGRIKSFVQYSLKRARDFIERDFTIKIIMTSQLSTSWHSSGVLIGNPGSCNPSIYGKCQIGED